MATTALVLKLKRNINYFESNFVSILNSTISNERHNFKVLRLQPFRMSKFSKFYHYYFRIGLM